MNPAPDPGSALPWEELAITPAWVKAPPRSYQEHPSAQGGGQERGRRPPQRKGRPHPERPRAGEGRPPAAVPSREPRRSFPPSGPANRHTDRGERRRGGGQPARADRPRVAEAPVEVSFFPEEKGFQSMLAALRQSRRAYALFDLAKLLLNKPERHGVRLMRKKEADGSQPLLFLVVPSESPFLTQQEAIRFALRHHASLIYRETKTPIEPPKGNFAFVNRCGITGELLGPPNYHEYQARLIRHHQQRLSRMPFEQFKARIQTVRDPEAVKAWVEEMSFRREYECLLETAGSDAKPAAPAAAIPPPQPPVESAVPLGPPETSPLPSSPPEQPAAAPPRKVFRSREELEQHFVAEHLNQIITAAPEVYISGQASRQIAHPGIQEAVRQAWERERKYPFETANGIRGRLRREGFHLFKRQGITYISVAKPKQFETLDGLTESVRRIICHLRAHPGAHPSELLKELTAPQTPPQTPAPADGPAAAETTPLTPPSTVPPPPLSEEQVLADLHWLIVEGYVVEFSDGRLWTPEERPPQPPPPPSKKEKGPRPTTTPPSPAPPSSPEISTATSAPLSATAGVPTAANAETTAESSTAAPTASSSLVGDTPPPESDQWGRSEGTGS